LFNKERTWFKLFLRPQQVTSRSTVYLYLCCNHGNPDRTPRVIMAKRIWLTVSTLNKPYYVLSEFGLQGTDILLT